MGGKKESAPKERPCSSKNVIDQVLLRRDHDHKAKTVKIKKVQQKEKSQKAPVRLVHQISLRVSAI